MGNIDNKKLMAKLDAIIVLLSSNLKEKGPRQIKALSSAGMTYKQIGNILGISYSKISEALKEDEKNG